MKLNMIIGKRQIILAALVLGLTAAIYLNFSLAGKQIDPVDADPTASGTIGENYGDAVYTGNADGVVKTDGEKTNAEFFAQARLTRQKMREESVQTIQTMLADTALGDDEQNSVSQRAAAIAQAIEVENKIENLIVAKGFSECIAYIDAQSANIVVQTDGLLQSEAAQIKDIVLSETELEPEDIKIVEVK